MKTHKNNQWRTSMQITTNRHKASTSLVFSFCNKKKQTNKKTVEMHDCVRDRRTGGFIRDHISMSEDWHEDMIFCFCLAAFCMHCGGPIVSLGLSESCRHFLMRVWYVDLFLNSSPQVKFLIGFRCCCYTVTFFKILY